MALSTADLDRLELSTADLDRFADMLRSKSRGWQNAKYEYDQVKEVLYSQMTRKRVDSGDSATLEAVLVHTFEYLLKRLGGAPGAFVDDSFIVEYNVRGNMDRPACFELDCLDLSFKVDWNVRKVETVLYNGEATKVIIPSNIRSSVIRRCRTAFCGQNKITRLVKGCLMYLDHEGKGAVAHRMPSIATMEYNLDNVHAALASGGDRAYVFSDQVSQNVSSWILYAMCEEYPHHVIGGMEHISIPADADKIVLVSYNSVSIPEDVELSAGLIWGTLIMYTKNFGLGRELEKALAIACTLRQNKYLKKIGLPKVISNVDLIYPILPSMPRGVTGNTLMDVAAANILGRAHQMLMMILVKDFYVHACCTMKGDVDRNVRSLFSRDSDKLLEYMEDKCVDRVVDILQLTSPMIWLTYLDTEELSIISKTSVFEGFWLVEYPKEVLRGGVISCLKKGMKHPIRIMRPGINIDSYSILMNEIMLGGGSSDLGLPDGAFNVRFCGMRSTKEEEDVPETVFDKIGKEPKIAYKDDNVTDTWRREDACWGWELDSGEEEGGDEKYDDDNESRKDDDCDGGDGPSLICRYV